MFKLLKGLKNRFFINYGDSGAKLTTNGINTNWRSNFSDEMKAATVNARNWTVTESSDGSITAVAGVGIRVNGGFVNPSYASIKCKKGKVAIADVNKIKFSLNIIGTTRGGQGILSDNQTGEQMFFGLYANENNKIGVVHNTATAENYYLITTKGGTTTTSSMFTITDEAATDILIEIICEKNKVECFKDNVLIVTNTTNIPYAPELMPYVKATYINGAIGSKIDVDYIKTELE